MTAKWVLEHQFRRYFENHFTLRGRDKIGTTKDRILKGAFSKEVEEEFTKDEIKQALKHNIIKKDQIFDGVAVKNVYLFLLEECKYQPIWHKRMIQKVKNYIGRWL